MAAHFEHEHRQRQREADPEAARHVLKLRIGLGVRGDDFGFERHTADRTRARSDLADLRMHRARIDRAGRDSLGPRFGRFQIFGGIGQELRSATAGAEIIGLSVVLGAVLRRSGIDAHAANGILRHVRGHAVIRVVMRGVIVRVIRCTGLRAVM